MQIEGILANLDQPTATHQWVRLLFGLLGIDRCNPGWQIEQGQCLLQLHQSLEQFVSTLLPGPSYVDNIENDTPEK